MKKLLLLILLSTSFSANALSIELPVRLALMIMILSNFLKMKLEELTKLSNSDKDNLAYKSQIDELQVDI
jgi:ACR3 family arsenite efflux pump ArsB